MLSGMRMSARSAFEMGLVNQVVDSSTDERAFTEALLGIINEHLAAAPNAARRTKELLRRIHPLPDPGLFEFTAQAIAVARCSEEGQHGLGKFFEKKQPNWTVTLDSSEFGVEK
jgi:enoyl-CoA hydratase/carnithine racemase